MPDDALPTPARVLVVAAHRQHGAGRERRDPVISPAEGAVLHADGDHAAQRIPQRVGLGTLRGRVDPAKAEGTIVDERVIEPVRRDVWTGEPGVRPIIPLHGRAHPVAILQPDIVSHPDLVAVIQDRGAG